MRASVSCRLGGLPPVLEEAIGLVSSSGSISPAAFAIILNALFGLSGSVSKSPSSPSPDPPPLVVVGANDIPATSALREISFICARLALAMSLSGYDPPIIRCASSVGRKGLVRGPEVIAVEVPFPWGSTEEEAWACCVWLLDDPLAVDDEAPGTDSCFTLPSVGEVDQLEHDYMRRTNIKRSGGKRGKSQFEYNICQKPKDGEKSE